MITFQTIKDVVILEYQAHNGNPWAFQNLERDEYIRLKNTYYLTIDKLYNRTKEQLSEYGDNDDTLEFVFGHLEKEYFKIDNKILGTDIGIFFHETIPLLDSFFTAIKNISIFRKIDAISKENIYIGGKEKNNLPIEEFLNMIKNFPNSYELKKYSEARVSTVLRNYMDDVVDGVQKYNQYMNKKISRKGIDLEQIFKENELKKNEIILQTLKEMLENEPSYSEKQWQKELLKIILLLFPKYIKAFPEAPVRDSYQRKDRSVDFLLVDSTGNVDVVEIKRPFDSCIVTKNTYRDNYIPLRELSGTIMQIEKYIFHLNKSGKAGEDKLTKKYQKDLPQDLTIKVINPKAIIVMGREAELSNEQKSDFEVIKRKYKNIIDIISYDDLLQRLEFTIELLKK